MTNIVNFTNELKNLIVDFTNNIQEEQRGILEDIQALRNQYKENAKAFDAVSNILNNCVDVVDTLSLNNRDVVSTFNDLPEVMTYEQAESDVAIEESEDESEDDIDEADEDNEG